MGTVIFWAVVSVIVLGFAHPKSRPHMVAGARVIFWFVVGYVVTGVLRNLFGGGRSNNSSGWPQEPQHW